MKAKMTEIAVVPRPYIAPSVIAKGRLAQFAGSPLGKQLWNPLDLPQK